MTDSDLRELLASWKLHDDAVKTMIQHDCSEADQRVRRDATQATGMAFHHRYWVVFEQAIDALLRDQHGDALTLTHRFEPKVTNHEGEIMKRPAMMFLSNR